jgi:archaetidylinositol phosphate synthase
MLSTLKPHAEKKLRPVARLFSKINPNVISLTGLIFPVLFFVFLINKDYILALLVFLFNGMDMVDGMVARDQGKVTAFGGFLDSTIDRFADFTIIAAFGFSRLVGYDIVLPLIMLTYLISYIRSRTELAAKGKLVASVGLIERTERLIAIFIGLMLYAIFPNATISGQNIVSITFILLILLSLITVAQRVAFAYSNL